MLWNCWGALLCASSLLLAAGCGGISSDGDASTSTDHSTSTSISLTHQQTVALPSGTHRPEILATADGNLMLVVVEPSGTGTGQVKHRGSAGDKRSSRARSCTRSANVYVSPLCRRPGAAAKSA